MPSALSEVVRDIRRQREPDLDWDRLENNLLSDLERGRPPRYSQPRRSSVFWAGMSIAAAAVVALFVLGRSPERDAVVPNVVSGDAAPRALRGADLEVGQRLTTGERALSVHHPGLGEWRLEPLSSGEVRANGDTVVVQLQSGTLSAEIVPSARPETFVVEVGKVRVSVHGTEFSVRRDVDQAYVVVTEGVVGVNTDGQVEQTLFEAPASGRFRLVGKHAGQALDASGSVHSGRSQRASRARNEASAPKALQQEPTFSEVEAGLSEVESVLRQCLVDSTASGERVSVSLETRVRLRIDGDGSVARYGFSPPLAPALEACAGERLKSVHFEPSVTGAHVIRDLLITLD